jgi:hypothetical protein
MNTGLPKDYSKRNYPISKEQNTKFTQAKSIEFESFSIVKSLKTPLLVEIVEKIESVNSKKEWDLILSTYGHDAIQYIQDEYLTDKINNKISSFC